MSSACRIGAHRHQEDVEADARAVRQTKVTRASMLDRRAETGRDTGPAPAVGEQGRHVLADDVDEWSGCGVDDRHLATERRRCRRSLCADETGSENSQADTRPELLTERAGVGDGAKPVCVRKHRQPRARAPVAITSCSQASSVPPQSAVCAAGVDPFD